MDNGSSWSGNAPAADLPADVPTAWILRPLIEMWQDACPSLEESDLLSKTSLQAESKG